MPTTLPVGSSGPLPVERPASPAALGDLIRRTRAAGHGLYPVGGGTALDLGPPPLKPGVACDTTALAGVIDYPARDLTITVRAGTTVAALQAELANEGQWLPLDVPSPERATLGGAAAVNASGPRRYGHGTLRDYVIGISFASDDGAEVRAGGRVVKNVAGYDLMKLQIGALGTLGVVTQLTLKVKPKPEASAAVSFGCDAAALGPVLDALAASRTRPVAVELLNGAAWAAAGLGAAPSGTWAVLVAFEEKAAAVEWQVKALRDELAPLPVRDLTDRPDVSALDALTALQTRPGSRFIGKRAVLPSQVAEAVLGLPTGAAAHAHALTGVIWVHADEGVPPGFGVRRCPPGAKGGSNVWGEVPGGWDLMRHVKRALDPDNVFNPGRLFGDL